MEWYRDPIWQFVGAIISVIAIFVSYVFFKRQGKQKRISYEVISNTALVNVKDDVKSKMQIFFEKKPVIDIHLIIVKIINSGNEPIVKSDYETPINIEFDDKSETLEAEVIKVSPDDLKVEIENTKETVSIKPLLLNPGDSVMIKTFLTNFRGQLKVSGRIAGVKEITQLGSKNSSSASFHRDIFFVYAISIIGSLGCAVSVFAFFSGDLLWGVYFIITGGILLAIALASAFDIAKRIKNMQQ
jgi:hypothetical protein